MAKKSAVQKDKRRRRMVERDRAKRARLKATAEDRSVPAEDRFAARLKLAEMPRNGSKVRVRNRCELSGRSRGFYRRFRLSRVAVRELGATGQIPGMVKASW